MKFFVVSLPYMFLLAIIIMLFNIHLLSGQQESYIYTEKQKNNKYNAIISSILTENFIYKESLKDTSKVAKCLEVYSSIYFEYVKKKLNNGYDFQQLLNIHNKKIKNSE